MYSTRGVMSFLRLPSDKSLVGGVGREVLADDDIAMSSNGDAASKVDSRIDATMGWRSP